MGYANENESVSRKEFEERLRDQRWIHHAEIHQALDEARRLQASEYERRLSELNHAHAEAKAKEAEYVTRDKYESYVAQAESARNIAFERMDERIRAIEKNLLQRIDSLDLSRAGGVGRTGGLSLGWRAVIGAIGLALILLQIYSLIKK